MYVCRGLWPGKIKILFPPPSSPSHPLSFFFFLSLFLSQTAHAQAHCTQCYYHNLPSGGDNPGVQQVSFRRSSPARNFDSTLKICAIIAKIKKIVFTHIGLEIYNWVVSNLSLIVSGDNIVIPPPSFLIFNFFFYCVSLYSALNINVIEQICVIYSKYVFFFSSFFIQP